MDATAPTSPPISAEYRDFVVVGMDEEDGAGSCVESLIFACLLF